MMWQMAGPALKLCERLWPESDQRNPHEILKLDENTAAIVLDIDGVDYIVTMSPVPIQRPRPTQ
jgi:mannose-1-phosphate guanylyltransferase